MKRINEYKIHDTFNCCDGKTYIQSINQGDDGYFDIALIEFFGGSVNLINATFQSPHDLCYLRKLTDDREQEIKDYCAENCVPHLV